MDSLDKMNKVIDFLCKFKLPTTQFVFVTKEEREKMLEWVTDKSYISASAKLDYPYPLPIDVESIILAGFTFHFINIDSL